MKKLIPFLLCPLMVSIAAAQSSHYWTETYGTRSMLLSGVVTGSVEDLGAVYYNPARLTQFKTPAFVISGQVYELSKVKLNNALGDGLNIEQTQFGGGPALVSGTFRLKFTGKSQFAYAFLTRVNHDENLSYYVNELGNFLEGLPGDEYFSGEINVQNRYKDEWMGLSWAYPISEKLSIGISGFYSNIERAVGTRYQLQAYAPQIETTATFLDARSFAYNSHSLLFKLGASYKAKGWSAGFVITTPKLQGRGKASTSFETYLAGIDSTSDQSGNDIYVLNRQDNLPLTHRSPLSIAIGGGFRLGNRSLLHLGAEWFSGIDSYTLLASETFPGQSNNIPYRLQVDNELAPVFNYGIGLEVYVHKQLSLFGSFATDYSAVRGEPDLISDFNQTIKDNNLDANRFHFGLGTDIKTKFANLTLGAMYSSSRDSFSRSFTIDEGMDPVTEDVDVIHSRWRFLIGFEFLFIDNLIDRVEEKFN